MTTARQHWLIKSEPKTYSFEQLAAEGHTRWDGVRNFAARNHLRAMKKGDLCLYYHSGDDKAAVGVARVTREAFPDPTAKGMTGALWTSRPSDPCSAPSRSPR
jgi:predicted RNA-binding protein with PUA-like domain